MIADKTIRRSAGRRIIPDAQSFLFDSFKRASSPYINRFLQPDTIIPELSNPQSWNRYSYVANRPVSFNDPTGHMMTPGDGGGSGPTPPIRTPDEEDDEDTDTNNNGIPDVPDPWAEVPPAHGECQYDLLLECLYSGGLLPDGDYIISDEEWAEFTLALFMDVHRRAGEGFFTLKFNPENQTWPFAPFHNENYNHRAIYDTPFWDGNGTLNGNVCFSNGQCHDRNDVNYIAQGMWSAAAYEGKAGGKFIANYWKQDQYGHEASPEVLYWVEVGVDLYNAYNFQPAP